MPELDVPEPQQRPHLPDEVASRIRDRIMTGHLRAGTHLHLERLSEELGISVTPVREALLALRGEGFVDLQPRRGFTVLPLSRGDLVDTYRLQAVIAGELAARTASKINGEQLGELDSLLTTLQHALRERPHTAEEIDSRFQHTIFAIAGAAKLCWFLGIALRYSPRNRALTCEDETIHELGGHRKILRALGCRDAEAARSAMREHVLRNGRLLIHHLDTRGFWPDTPAPANES